MLGEGADKCVCCRFDASRRVVSVASGEGLPRVLRICLVAIKKVRRTQERRGTVVYELREVRPPA
ncbi:MAG: hypothetical protein QOF10_1482, partial [Kribbellaceae bacterium]|nr:hypothetical protein [Kribbellaceae bacterium]